MIKKTFYTSSLIVIVALICIEFETTFHNAIDSITLLEKERESKLSYIGIYQQKFKKNELYNSEYSFANVSSGSISCDLRPEIIENKVFKRVYKKRLPKEKKPEIFVDIFYDDSQKIISFAIKNIDKLNVLITNLRGKRVLHGPLNTETIDISGFSSDIYTIDLYKDENKLKSLRFSKS